MNINDKAQQQLNNFWNNRIEKFGNSFEVVGWTEESQRQRFEAILQLGELADSSLLDVGCGRGDLLSFLTCKDINLDYTGYDLRPEMINFCHKLHPKKKDNFKVCNILEETPERRFDYATCIGVLNQVTSPDSPEFAASFIQRLYSLVDKAIAVSITSLHAPRKTPDTFYFDPADMLQRISKFTTNFKLDHSYLRNDFTLFLYKD